MLNFRGGKTRVVSESLNKTIPYLFGGGRFEKILQSSCRFNVQKIPDLGPKKGPG